MRLLRGALDRQRQEALAAEVLALAESAWFRPVMPRWGQPLSVRMANLGLLGWIADRSGYRYSAGHPDTGAAWPPMPPMLLELWDREAGCPVPPECCLVNLYGAKARMGLHQDRDEQAFDAPVLSVSLGDSALFRFGGTERSAPTRSVELHSGDLLVMGGASRLCFHGIDRIRAGSSDLLPGGGRLNLTLRRVSPVPAA
jgi:alkylated DNA repair protein (DNA oxidative demethylase)